MVELRRNPGARFAPSFSRGAFTLIELLVAMAVFSLIVIAMVGVVSQVGKLWQHGEGQNQRRANGRAMLQFIARELQAATLPVSAPSLVSATTSSKANLQMVANLPANSDNSTIIPSSVLNPHAIFWQAPIARDGPAGDLPCIGYFLRWDTTTRPGVALGRLCRYYVKPSDAAYLIYTQQGGEPANWLSNIDTVAPGSDSGYRGWFADNVIAFWVRCLDGAGQPITQTASGQSLNGGYGFDSRQGYTDSAQKVHKPNALPAAVEIALVTVDASAALRIAAPINVQATDPAIFYEDIQTFMNALPSSVKSGAQLYSTKVYLQNSTP
ncbi:hypothetical protein BH09VER1_BH09VER1_07250 [soil metagenome]